MGDAYNKPFQTVLLNAKPRNENSLKNLNSISKRQAKANAMDEEFKPSEDFFYSVTNSKSTSVERTTKELVMDEVTPLKKKQKLLMKNQTS